MSDKLIKKPTNGWQSKKFHEYINETYGWMDNDVKKFCLKAWYASVRANDQTDLLNELATQLESAVDFIKRVDDWRGSDPNIESMIATLEKLKNNA